MANERTYDQMLADLKQKLSTKAGRKQEAQLLLMDGISKVLGYWTETDPMVVDALPPGTKDEFGKLLQAQADRVARLLGFEESWTS